MLSNKQLQILVLANEQNIQEEVARKVYTFVKDHCQRVFSPNSRVGCIINGQQVESTYDWESARGALGMGRVPQRLLPLRKEGWIPSTGHEVVPHIVVESPGSDLNRPGKLPLCIEALTKKHGYAVAIVRVYAKKGGEWRTLPVAETLSGINYRYPPTVLEDEWNMRAVGEVLDMTWAREYGMPCYLPDNWR